LIETEGLVCAVEVADAALKAANVELLGYELTRGLGMVTVKHMKPADADYFGVKDGQMIKARAAGPRGLVLDQVLVRIADANDLESHIDTDEGNAAGLKTGDRVEILC
jgi:propanediol utilization protein